MITTQKQALETSGAEKCSPSRSVESIAILRKSISARKGNEEGRESSNVNQFLPLDTLPIPRYPWEVNLFTQKNEGELWLESYKAFPEPKPAQPSPMIFPWRVHETPEADRITVWTETPRMWWRQLLSNASFRILKCWFQTTLKWETSKSVRSPSYRPRSFVIWLKIWATRGEHRRTILFCNIFQEATS